MPMHDWTRVSHGAFHDTDEADVYAGRRRSIAVRTGDGDRLVALIEAVSPGNKGSRHAIQAFRRKVRRAIAAGVHVLVVDPLPPGRRDPRGVHPLIWSAFRDTDFAPPVGQPLTLRRTPPGRSRGRTWRPSGSANRSPTCPCS